VGAIHDGLGSLGNGLSDDTSKCRSQCLGVRRAHWRRDRFKDIRFLSQELESESCISLDPKVDTVAMHCSSSHLSEIPTSAEAPVS
jgi:hypothetical protein